MEASAAESNGTSQETEALYREHGSAVAVLCRSLLRDRSEAEDATQQVFLSAHRALLGGTAPREPLAWLLTVARHECYARRRERATAPLPTGDPPEQAGVDASAHVLRAGDLASVWDEVGQMPPAQREAFLLREIRGLSYGQLADELSLSPPSVRSLLLRARARLRRRLRDVAAFGSVPWLQGLVRLAGGGEGASPVPAATKAAAVGLGALALVGGGDVPRPVHHASAAPVHRSAPQRTATHRRHLTVPVAAPAAPLAPHPARHSSPAHASSRDDSSSGASHATDRGHDDSPGGTAAAPSVQPTTDGRDGGGGSSSSGPSPTPTSSDGGPGPSPTSGSSTDGGSSADGGSGSDGGSGTVTTTTSSGSSDGSGSGGSDSHDGGSTGGHGG